MGSTTEKPLNLFIKNMWNHDGKIEIAFSVEPYSRFSIVGTIEGW